MKANIAMNARLARLLLIVLVSLPASLPAQIDHNIQVMQVGNYTSYVIDSDADNADPAFNRDAILVDSDILTSNSGENIEIVVYQLEYRLLNEAGNPHPILTSGGVTNETYTYSITNSQVMFPNTAFLDSDQAVIVPAQPLDPYDQYTVELRLIRGGAYTGDTASDGPRSYYHFTSTDSGDDAYNVISTLDSAAFTRTYAVDTVPGKDAFRVDITATFRRYDNFEGDHTPFDGVPYTLTWELREGGTDAVVPLTHNATNLTVSMFKYDPPPPVDPIVPRERVINRTIEIIPAVQLDSVNNNYYVTVSIEHTEDPVAPATVAGNSQQTANQLLLHFNGTLMFGAMETGFTSIDNDPFPFLVVPGSYAMTSLGVDNQGGFLVANPAFTYGDGTDLIVRLLADGTAELDNGFADLNIPLPNSQKVNNVRYEIQPPAQLTPTGLIADIEVTLPTGLGYRSDTNGHFLQGTIVFDDVELDAQLVPVTDLTYAPGTSLFASEESKPVWLQVSDMTWQVALGRFVMTPEAVSVHYVRHDEHAYLNSVAALLVNSHGALKRSNEKYFNAVSQAGPTLHVQAHTDCTARLTTDLTLAGDQFRTHFPYNARVRWSGGGTLDIDNDHIAAGSQLLAVDPVVIPYTPDCSDDGCGPGDGSVEFLLTPDADRLNVTRDGGLIAAGTLPAPTDLRWGSLPGVNDYAHKVYDFTDGNFHMPGGFLRGDQVALSEVHHAAALLFTGVAATNLNYLERPGQNRYEDGFADYAGINFAVGNDAAHQSESVLGGTPSGDYDLKGISKYCARPGGVTGIHDAVPGSFPETLTIYGYEFNFSNYGLSFLDSQQHESLIEGHVHLPYPSNFDQEFEQLKISCIGALESAEVAQDDIANSLQYWNSDFNTLAMEFRRGDDCDFDEGTLVLGVETSVAHVPETLYGLLGFLPNGNLVSKSDGVPDIDSRLKLPNRIRIDGPAEESYLLNPVVDVYYNDFDHYPNNEGDPPVGWVNVAGKIDVPFFEDLKVHLHTSPDGDNENAPIFLMGGWPRQDETDNAGWQIDDKNYFTAAYFDDENRGYPSSPGGITPDDYRNFETEQYHVRAQRTWLGVVTFDYPLSWSPVTRAFQSFEPKANKFFVMELEHQLKYLSAENAEITFGAQFEALPLVNIANLAFNAIDEATGVSDAVASAIGGPQHDQIKDGFGQMDEMLDANLTEFYKPVFADKVQPFVDDLYGQLQTAYNADPDNFPAAVSGLVNAHMSKPAIGDLLTGLPGADASEAGVMQRIDGILANIELAVNEISAVLAENGQGEREIAKNLMQALVGEMAAQFLGGFVDNIMNPMLEDADPTLDKITETLAELGSTIGTLRGGLADPTGFGTELADSLLADAIELEDLAPDISGPINDFFGDVEYSIDSPFADYTPEEVKGLMMQEIQDQFLGSAASANAQVVLRQRMYDNDRAIRLATDTVFQTLNDVIRLVISETAEEIGGEFSSFLGSMGETGAAADINGYAHINGDSLKELRVDVHAQLNLGNEMEFNAYFQIKELDSSETPGCSYNGVSATEVSLGATDVKLGWISPELRVSVGTKFTFDSFDDGFQGFPLLGMAGAFELTGSLNYEAFEIKYLGAAMAFGVEENYLSAAAGMRVNKYEVFGGIYFGRACTVEPIELWDPLVADALGQGPFTGFYAYGEGWIPVNELIGIPASCLFNISVGMGLGGGVFLEGPTFVGKMKAGISGELLCILLIKGEIVGVGVLEGIDANVVDGLTVKGQGTVGAELGPCPFCIKVEKSVGLTFSKGKWKFDK